MDAPTEAWILAGTLDGIAAQPPLLAEIGGVPHVLRIACELALAGAKQIAIVWQSEEPAPDVTAIASDPRLATRAELVLVRDPPRGADRDPILVARADRIFHRDIPKAVVAAWRARPAILAKVAGDVHDAVLVTDRELATCLARSTRVRGGLGLEIGSLCATGPVAKARVPYLGFTVAARDHAALVRAERQLVRSLRKSADGIAARLLNRRLSLPCTRLLMRTRITPNHVTIAAFLCTLAGALVIARGGYAAGALGMLLVNTGSVIDGIDGELARLRFQFSRAGQWLDTLADDLGNLAYSTGIMLALTRAGAAWALPLWSAALAAFLATQATQYYLIATVYRSGDLAAIPWAYQSSEFLSQRSTLRSTLPKLLKRDFALTTFTALALAGRLDLVLALFSAGALTFFVVFFWRFNRSTRRQGE